MSLGYGRLSATRQRLGLGVDFKHPPRKGGGGQTLLRREANGTVTVVSLASIYRLNLTREGDGSVTVRSA